MPAVRRTLLGALCSVFSLALTASASADSVSIAAPTAPPPEDVAFALTMTGATDIHADVFGARLTVKVRPAGGVPCAVNSRVDAGSEIAGESLGNKGGSYQKPATYTPPD